MSEAARAQSNDRQIRTRLFGELLIAPERIIAFAEGIPGFENSKEFALLPAAAKGSYWLQSMIDPALAFFLVEAALLAPAAFGETPDAMAIVTLPRDESQTATANLRAPLLIDSVAGIGMQLIGIDETWSTAHPFNMATLLR